MAEGQTIEEMLGQFAFKLWGLAEATLAVLEHDTEETRQRAWKLAHQALGHDSWEGKSTALNDGEEG